jgi:hypothetical protein
MTASVPTISPAGDRLPRIGHAAKTAWIDLYRVFAALTGVWPIALAISVALSLVSLLLTGSGAFVSILISATNAFFLTPYFIAVHRFIIRDEATPGYRLRPGEPRFQKFFGWSLILLASANVFAIFPPFLSLLPSRVGAAPIGFIVGAALNLFLMVLLLWAWLRLTIVFPAIAVDAPSANWRSVMADTRGYAWRIFLIELLAGLPFLAMIVVVAIVFVGYRIERETIALGAIGTVLELPYTTLMIVIASRLYQWLGNAVNRPPPGLIARREPAS